MTQFITQTSIASGVVVNVLPPHQENLSHWLADLEHPATRLDAEYHIQNLLNKGEISHACLEGLQKIGYSISYNPDTIKRFQDFKLSDHVLLAEAIRSATPRGGLLLDRNRMYRPGPCPTGHAAKGYDEIFAVFETQTTEKKVTGKSVADFLNAFYHSLPEAHQKETYTILDIGCGNGIQAKYLLEHLTIPYKLHGVDNQPGCIEKCIQLLPGSHFLVHDISKDPLIETFQHAIDILFISHVYMKPELIPQLREKLEYYAAENSLILFINNEQGSDNDEIVASCNSFLRGKPSSLIIKEYRKELYIHKFNCLGSKIEAQLEFPELTPQIESFLLHIQRGDYENPYPHISKEEKTFKALLEFIGSYPLESMTSEEIGTYLKEIKTRFKKNKGNFLKIFNKLIMCTPPTAHCTFVKNLYETLEKVQEKVFLEQKDIQESQKLSFSLEKLNEQLHFSRTFPLWEEYVKQFERLADILVQKQEYPKASAIFWYLKREYLHFYLGQNDTQLMDELEVMLDSSHRPLDEKQQLILEKLGPIWTRLNQAIDNLEKDFLTNITSCPNPSIFGIEKSIQDQKALRAQREEGRQKLEQLPTDYPSLCAFYEEMNSQMQIFISTIINECASHLATLGYTPPCDYAFISLGSLSRQEMTPFSDLEFAILINSSDPQHKPYFRNLNKFFHLRILNLGETIIPSLNIQGLHWFFDSVMRRGLSFDGSMTTASKTPYGKQTGGPGDYELISTVEDLLKFQTKEWVPDSDVQRQIALNRYHLPTILSCTSYLAGNPSLAQDYEETLQRLDVTRESDLRERALILMKEDLGHLHIFVEKEVAGKAHEVKKDLYRFPQVMLDSLADYYQLKSKNSFARVEELESRNLLNPQAALELKHLFMLTQRLRLKIYYDYGKQKGDFKLADNQGELYEIYYRLFPLQDVMRQFVQGPAEQKTIALQNAVLCSKTPYYQGLIDYRLIKYRSAHDNLSAVENPPNPLFYHETLGDLQLELAKYTEALASYDKALSLLPLSDPASLFEGSLIEEAVFIIRQLSERASLLKKKGDIYKILVDSSTSEQLYNGTEQLLNTLFTQTNKQLRETVKESIDYNLLLDVIIDLHKQLEGLYRSYFAGKGPVVALLRVRELIRNRGTFQRMKWDPLETSKKSVRIGLSKDKEFGVKLDLSLAETLRAQAGLEEGRFHYQNALRRIKISQITFKGYYKEDCHPQIADGLSIEASILGKMGHHEESLKLDMETLEIHRRVLGEDHPTTASSHGNLGSSLGKLGNYPEALRHQQKALEIHRKVFGEDHPDIAASYGNIGSSLLGLGNYPEALKHYQKTLEIKRKVFGEDHSHTAASCGNVGLLLGKLGNHSEALKHQQKALEINCKFFGEDHPTTAISYDQVGISLMELGDHPEALKHRQKVLEIYRKFFGEDHPTTAASYSHVGVSLMELGNYAEALKHQQKALEINCKFFGEDHPTTAALYNNLGLSLWELGNYAEALKHQQKALEIRLKVFGENHPTTAALYNNLGSSLCELGNYPEALKHHQKALEINHKILGEDHPTIATIYRNLGLSLGKLGNHPEALKHHQKALEIYRKIFGEDHPDTAASYHNLGASLLELENHAEALKHQQKAIEIRRKTFDEDHPHTAIGYNEETTEEAYAHFTAAKAMGEEDNYEAAIAFLLQALQISPHLQQAQAYLDFCLSHSEKIPPTPERSAATGPAMEEKEQYAALLFDLLEHPQIRKDHALQEILATAVKNLIESQVSQLSREEETQYQLIQQLVGEDRKLRFFIAEKLRAIHGKEPSFQPALLSDASAKTSIVASSLSSIPSMAFGRAKWEQYFGFQVIEPPLFPDIDQILAGPCPIFPGKKVADTHFLKLIPENMTLERLESLTQNPKQGNKIGFECRDDDAWAQYGKTSSGRAHWVLMTNDVIPDSERKIWEDQQILAGEFKGHGYELLSGIDAATCLLLEYVETGRRFYLDKPRTWTRCVEQVKSGSSQWPLAIGGFAPGGVSIGYSAYQDTFDDSGVAVVRRVSWEAQYVTVASDDHLSKA